MELGGRLSAAMGWGWYLSQAPLGLLRVVLIGLSRCGAGKEGSCVQPLPWNGGALCWPLKKSVLAEGSAELAGTALLWAQPPAEQGPAPCRILPSRQRSSLSLSLNSQQVSCGSQPHHKQLLRQEKIATSLWDPFFWWRWLERFPCAYPRCRKRVWATDTLL